MKTRLLLILPLCCLFSSISMGQKAHMKYGNIDKEEIQQTNHPLDSTAAAVVLGDYGYTSFKYNPSRGWIVSFQRHKRIKILNKNGYDYANFEIPYYKPEGRKAEQILAIKGTTYTLESGNIVKTKMAKTEVFDKKINKYWSKKTFTLPAIKEGSIIEVSYTIESQYLQNLREWTFQESIPTVWSEYRLIIPEFFTYKTLSQGYHPLDIVEKNKQRQAFRVQQSVDGVNSVESTSEKMRFVAKNIPAFRNEPYMTSIKDYVSKIKFELSMVQYPGEPISNYLGTWSAMNKTFLDSKSFGEQIEGSNFLNKTLESITSTSDDPYKKIAAIYYHVKSRMHWDGYHGKWISTTLKKAYDKKTGSAAEINLLLTAMLKKAGIEADPVLLSTRDNGFVRTSIPNSDQFNYVVCKVSVDGKTLLLDATDPYLPMSMIPEKCLNGRGWVVSENKSGWVNLTSGKKKLNKVSANFSLDSNGMLSGSVKTTYDGYNAKKARSKLLSDGLETYSKGIKPNELWEINNVSIEGEKTLNEPFVESIEAQVDLTSESTGDFLYLNPIFFLKEEQNPFISIERKFPVDFASTSEKMFYLSLTLPDGYSVEEFPKNTLIALSENAAKFQYNVAMAGNQITVLSRLFINKSLFSQLEYGNLKEFYARIVAKHAEIFVIKKSN